MANPVTENRWILGSSRTNIPTVKFDDASVMLRNNLLCIVRIIRHAIRKLDEDVIEKAIIQLQGLTTDPDAAIRATVKCALIKAFLTRLAFHGWIEDWDNGSTLWVCEDETEVINPLMVAQWNGEREPTSRTDIDSALALVDSYRRMVDIRALNVAIRRTSDLISTKFPQPNNRFGRLHMIHARALSMRFMCLGRSGDLEKMSGSFGYGKVREGDPNPMAYIRAIMISFTWLAQVSECGTLGNGLGHRPLVLLRLRDFLNTLAEDHEALRSYNEGVKMMNGDISQLNEAISYLSKLVTSQPFPHPRRSISIDALGDTLLKRFELEGDFEDLEKSIGWHREGVELRFVPHPKRFESLNSLARALSIRFEKTGDIRDLEESISLRRHSLECKPDQPSSIKNLANDLSARYKQTGNPADLDESFSRSL
ncbi:hypothetical protein FA15DRAFT_644423 [Coprinopsis marcescibilis]|uniref:Uncharacterized protein n=1 Tax=Coprinopsis marcescibilis TaxID=230819 RepID=A0A5C3KPH2_COPMA|nr:hypothetical protein FA15DRAFT_644423 [Coprinopsis marcescibilis]